MTSRIANAIVGGCFVCKCLKFAKPFESFLRNRECYEIVLYFGILLV